MAVSSDPIADAARAAVDGELIVFPTDTVYGLAANPAMPQATDGIFRAKRRDPDLTLPVLTSTTEAARAVARFDERAESLAAALWPGALTLVLPRTSESAGWSLGGDDQTVGVRVPEHRLARAVLDLSGPLAVTSANRSGEPPATTCEELR
ncbi:MAG TPA: L-threonylcarbamoyladenylate synthase, partial [Actinomycetota bacterium]|nr:L-threonylcarbamoyladenylate synthase [Actinomycetota bacterium]